MGEEEMLLEEKRKFSRDHSSRSHRRHTLPERSEEAAPMPQTLRALRTRSEQTLRTSSRNTNRGPEPRDNTTASDSPWAVVQGGSKKVDREASLFHRSDSFSKRSSRSSGEVE